MDFYSEVNVYFATDEGSSFDGLFLASISRFIISEKPKQLSEKHGNMTKNETTHHYIDIQQ